MPKNIIIACDGTDNQFGLENTNIVKLVSMLEKNSPDQLVYYDPGVGTIAFPNSAVGVWAKVKNTFSKVLGMGVRQNTLEAYRFLMDNFETGDSIFLFGFSRGAYTVRMLAGMVNFCGLLPKGNENQLDHVWDFYRIKKPKTADFDPFELGFKFKTNMSRSIKIHFVGTFDTVSSIGLGPFSKSYPYTLVNSSVTMARHALAIDERRTDFKPRLWKESASDRKIKTNVLQVWFPGVHADIGGGYKEEESGLSKNALVWMVEEARKAGLQIDPERYNRIALGQIDPKKPQSYCKPDALAPMHNELDHILWKIPEWLRLNFSWKGWARGFLLGQPRVIPEGALFHPSLKERMENPGSNYNPPNLPGSFTILL